MHTLRIVKKVWKTTQVIFKVFRKKLFRYFSSIPFRVLSYISKRNIKGCGCLVIPNEHIFPKIFADIMLFKVHLIRNLITGPPLYFFWRLPLFISFGLFSLGLNGRDRGEISKLASAVLHRSWLPFDVLQGFAFKCPFYSSRGDRYLQCQPVFPVGNEIEPCSTCLHWIKLLGSHAEHRKAWMLECNLWYILYIHNHL